MKQASRGLIIALAFLATAARAEMSYLSSSSYGPLVECPFHSQETLEGCTNILKWNTDEVCGERGSWISYALSDWLGRLPGVDRFTLNNLGRLHWWSGHSFMDDLLKYIGDRPANSTEDIGQYISDSWRSLTVYTLGGVVPFLIGVLILLILVIVIIPLLLMGTFRKQQSKKQKQHPSNVSNSQRIRPPLSKKALFKFSILHGIIILIVLICIISMLHNVNSVYYSVAPASCNGAALSEDFLIGTLRDTSSSTRQFAGISTALMGLHQLNGTLQSLKAEAAFPIPRRNKALNGLTSMYASVLWTDALLRAPNHFIGWSDVNGSKSVPFSLDMTISGASDFANISQFDSDQGEYGDLIQAANGTLATTYDIVTAITAAQEVVQDLQQSVANQLEHLSTAYNNTRETINVVTQWSEWNLGATYWTIALFTTLPLLGVIMALLISSSWKYRHDARRSGRNIPPSRLAQLGAGYVIFGFIFWGAILFIIGGGVLMASYFTSDACHFVESELFSKGRYNEYKIFDSIPPQLFDACLTETSNGSILDQYDKLYPDTLEIYLITGEVVDASLITSATMPHNNTQAYLAKNGVPLVIVPSNVTGLPMTDDRIRWSSLRQFTVLPVYDVAEYTNETMVPLSTPIYGLHDAQNALNEYLENAGCAVDEYYLCFPSMSCPDHSQLITMDTLYRYDQADLEAAIQAQNWQTIVTNMAASSGMRQALQCVADSTLVTANEKAEFYGGVWIAARKAAAMSPLYRVSPTVPSDPSVIDICPAAQACPVYHHTSHGQNHTLNIDLVEYSEWENMAADDVFEASHVISSEEVYKLVSSSVRKYNLGTVSARGLQSFNEVLDCRAVFDNIVNYQRSVCNGPASDIAAWGVATLIVATMHLLGAILIWPYWKSQRQPAIDETNYFESSAGATSYKQPGSEPSFTQLTPEDFLYASELGILPRVEACLTKFPPDSVQDIYYFNTPLHLAAYYGHIECVTKILEASWLVDPLNFKGNTPLMAVVCNITMSLNNKLQICKLLLDRGANPHKENIEKESPISAALKMSDHRELAALLIMYTPSTNK